MCVLIRKRRTGHKGNRFSDFLLGDSWKPNQDLYGIFPMIVGSIYVTAGAIIIGVPIGYSALSSWPILSKGTLQNT